MEYGKDEHTVGFGLGDFRAREKIVLGERWNNVKDRQGKDQRW